MNQGDDWTQVKDPRERKKLQNRNAQRLYRRRQKERIKELESWIAQERSFNHPLSQRSGLTHDNVEISVSGFCTGSSGDAGTSHATYRNRDILSNGATNGIRLGHPQAGPNFDTGCSVSTYVDVPSVKSAAHSQIQHTTTTPLFLATPAPLHSLALNQISPTSQFEYCPSFTEHESNDALKQWLEAMNERQESHGLDTLSTYGNIHTLSYREDKHVDHANSLGGYYMTPETSTCSFLEHGKHIDGPSPSDTAPVVNTSHKPKVPGNKEDATRGIAPQQALSAERFQIASSTEMDFINPSSKPENFEGGSLRSLSDHFLVVPEAAVVRSNKSVEKQLETVMEAVSAAGFDNLDSFITAYYCATLSGTSPLATQQRLSRQRRLPRVLADVFEASVQWKSSEQQALHEEFARIAQLLLAAEITQSHGVVKSGISHLLAQQRSAAGHDITDQILVDIVQLIQNEVSLNVRKHCGQNTASKLVANSK